MTVENNSEGKAGKLALIAVLILAVIISGFRSDSRKPLKNYVLMVSLDAFRWDYNRIYKTPNLNRLAADGVSAERMISSFPTNTFPNHYSIATGLYPDHHGLINNSFAAPDLGLFYRIGDRAAVENPAFYGGEPIWVTAQKQGIKAASYFWVGSEAPVAGMHPFYWKKYDESHSYEARIDTVVKWLGYPPEKRPGLVTLYFDEPDATSHDSGPVSEKTGRVVEHLDSLIGVLRAKLSQLPDAGRINLIVLSDHGMAEVSPERYVNLRQYIPERLTASIAGGNPVYLVNPAEGKGDSVLMLLKGAKGLKAWKKGELPARWNYGTHPRIPEIVVVADSSWSIGTWPDGSRIRGGAHGYDNFNPDLFSIFYADGPAFRKNFKVKELNNVDVYNLICMILGIKPAPNDGNPVNVKRMLR
ncbi:MAG: ectonucleotide pyrophosphatase/phosphodiesterase [Bacteroidales bacterium]|nr:ectonucleotide pyrophosphatase/phosphodiesterase [Bacteroidales bacterium]